MRFQRPLVGPSNLLWGGYALAFLAGIFGLKTSYFLYEAFKLVHMSTVCYAARLPGSRREVDQSRRVRSLPGSTVVWLSSFAM